MANLTNTERLAQIKALLPKGTQAQIAKHLGVSRPIVSQVLSGIRKSPHIADGIMSWFIHWAAQRPDVNQVDQALAKLQAAGTTQQ